MAVVVSADLHKPGKLWLSEFEKGRDLLRGAGFAGEESLEERALHRPEAFKLRGPLDSDGDNSRA